VIEPNPWLVGPEEGDRFLVAGGLLATVHKVVADQTGGAVAVAVHILEPGQLGSPRHVHRREHEISFVLQGVLGVEIGGRAFDAPPGTTVFKPKDVPHAFWNSGPAVVRFVEVFAPGGFEHYFADLEPLIPADTAPDGAALAALWAHYGLEMDAASMFELIERYGLTPPGPPPTAT
jgi:mannose-6-phosphate isomerase-like protein (cupin superfamily)